MSYPPGEWGGFKPNGNGGGRRDTLKWVNLDTIRPKPIEFALKPYLQRNSFHLLSGIKGVGKGTWLSYWAAQVTRGEFGERDQVIWIALGEDSYSIDVRPRIELAGGNPSKVSVLTSYAFPLPESVDELIKHSKKLGRVGMVVVDPLGGSLTGEKDTNQDFAVRPALSALNHAADEIACMILGIRHFSNKQGKRQEGSLSAVLGSSDWVNIPRAALGLFHDDEKPDLRHLFVIRGNRVADDTPGLLFKIEGVTPKWGGEEITRAKPLGESVKDPDELLAIRRSRKPSKQDANWHVIGAVLAAAVGYEMESDTLDAEVAKQTGLAVKTVKNERSRMKDAGLVKAYPEKDEFGQVLRWFVALTTPGAAEYVTSENGALVTPEPSLGPGHPDPRSQPYTPDSLGSGDLQGKTESAEPTSQTLTDLEGIRSGPGNFVTTDFHDFVTASDWVEAEGHRLKDDELVAVLAQRFGIAEGESFGLIDIAYDCRREAAPS